jgi:hypothetical protein
LFAITDAIPPEFVPATHQWLLTVLSIWWAFGQLFGSLVRPETQFFYGEEQT